jgi:site-specific recombinase XerD
MKNRHGESPFPSLVQDFFFLRLIQQRNASTRTVAAYRDTFRLLLGYLEQHLKKSPSSLTLEDLDASTVSAFLEHLEEDRGNSIRTRNARFAVIRAFLKYAAIREPTSLPITQKVLGIPMKRFERPLLGFLSRDEIKAIIDAPDDSTWSGRRDRVMFATLYNTGARVSEITALRIGDVSLENTLSVTFHGKGRKQRVVPLWKETGKRLKEWRNHLCGDPGSPFFPNSSGQPLSRSGVEHRLKQAVDRAKEKCPTLIDRKISPHTIRHTTAMHLLQSGVDLTVIALWLGHESPATTHMYIEADISMKEKALNKIQELKGSVSRYRAKDKLLQFLESL